MKIAIAGTRGIPNRYGGFEQFAEKISVMLADAGNKVWVYNPDYHDHKEQFFKNVEIISVSCPESTFGTLSHFWYDWLCMKDAIRRKANVIIMCGYGTSAPALLTLNFHNTRLIVNMDGMEWQRKKYNRLSKMLLKWCEKTTVKKADMIIADHPAIKKYYEEKYNVHPVYLPYGAEIQGTFDINSLEKYGLKKGEYFISVARDDPDNQVNEITEAWINSGTSLGLVIITNKKNQKFHSNHNGNLLIIEGLYDNYVLNNLRHFSAAVIHGHKVGGTNPSFLEAMASGTVIIAHNNIYNAAIIGENGLVFGSSKELTNLLKDFSSLLSEKEIWKTHNLSLISEEYNWSKIVSKYIETLKQLV